MWKHMAQDTIFLNKLHILSHICHFKWYYRDLNCGKRGHLFDTSLANEKNIVGHRWSKITTIILTIVTLSVVLLWWCMAANRLRILMTQPNWTADHCACRRGVTDGCWLVLVFSLASRHGGGWQYSRWTTSRMHCRMLMVIEHSRNWVVRMTEPICLSDIKKNMNFCL